MCDLFFASPLWFIVYCTRRSSATVLEICRPSKIVHSASCSHSSDNDIIAVSAHTERRRGGRAPPVVVLVGYFTLQRGAFSVVFFPRPFEVHRRRAGRGSGTKT